MKTLSMTIAALAFLAAAAQAAPRQTMPVDKCADSRALIIDNTHFIDANNILMFVTNHGNFGRDLSGVFGRDYGTWFPYTGDTSDISNNTNGAALETPLYAAGLWIGAVDSATGETRLTVAEYSDECVPGPMQGGTFIPDQPAFRIYKIYSDSLADNPNTDYVDWPVSQGAPVDDYGNPEILGDQTLWAVYNDADPGQHTNNSGSTEPLGLEIRQTTYAFTHRYSYTDAIKDIVFLRWRIFNEGGRTLENCRFSVWIDPDLGDFNNDLAGCDTLWSLGFSYNDGDFDSQYEIPPCLGLDLLQGPLRQTGNPADTGRMWGEYWPGYQNLEMTAFIKYTNGTDPDTAVESYNYMQGLQRDGQPYMYDGHILTYMASGNPLTGTGDLDNNSADRRFMVSTGPVTFRPGDSTEIMAALVMGLGADYLASIAKMKSNDFYAKIHYADGYDDPTDASDGHVPLPNDLILSQNHPNPFNSSTTIDFHLPRAAHVQLDVFNITGQKITTLLDRVLTAGRHTVTWDGANTGGDEVSTGIYLYRLRAGDHDKIKRMILLK